MRAGNRSIRLLGAPSALGIRPYEEGGIQELYRSPQVLRKLGLAERLGAVDLGDVLPPPYEDFVREPGRIRNEAALLSYSRELGAAIGAAASRDAFLLLLGGECSLGLGALLGLHAAFPGRLGLVYVDAHADFASPESSGTGSAAGMALSLALGLGETPLARLGGKGPLLVREAALLVGRRDEGEEEELGRAGLREISDSELRSGKGGAEVLASIGAEGLEAFWIHVDLDVLDPLVFPSVYVKTPGGLGYGELAELLRPLLRHPAAAGMHVALYDPRFDPDRRSGARLVRFLEELFASLDDAQD